MLMSTIEVQKKLRGPAYLQELIQPYRQGRELCSASHHLLNVPLTKSTVISNRAFGVAGPALWNRLPRDIRAITTLSPAAK